MSSFRHFFCKIKWRIRLRPSGLRRDKERGIRHERSEVSASIADRRARSAGQPHKKITLSAPCRKLQRKNEKTQEQVYLQS